MPHIHRDRKKLKDGEERVYVSIAHNVVEKPEGKAPRAKPVILARLGHEDDLDEGTVDGILGALLRYREKRFGKQAPAAEVAASMAEVVRAAEPALRVVASRSYGLRVVVEKVWQDLGIRTALQAVAGEHALSWDLERVIFAMVLHRLVDPGSKLACNDWVADEAWFPEADGWDVHHFYRALDLLDAHAEHVTEVIRTAAATHEQPDADGLLLRLVDTTSSYAETDEDDAERAAMEADAEEDPDLAGDDEDEDEREGPLRMRGKSKDHRPDKPQIVVGMVCDGAGQPVAHQVYAGNTNDQKVTVEMVRLTQATCPEGRVVVGCDSGMGGTGNLKALDELGVDRVTGVPLRSLAKAEEMLRRPGRWRQHPTKEHFKLRVLEVAAEDTPTGRAEVWVATRNDRDRHRILAKLARQEKKVRAALRKDSHCDDHGRPTCKVLASPQLGRFVKVTKRGKLALDTDRLALERRRAGVKVIRSTLTDLEPLVSLRVYEALLAVERGFRDLKGPVLLRPMYHRVPRRIRAHVLVCMLALRVLRALELKTGRTLRQLRKVFGPHRATQLEGPTARHWQRPPWSEDAAEVLSKLAIADVPTMWGMEALAAGSNGS